MANVYQICLEGHLDHRWANWLNDLTLTHQQDGTTMLFGPIADQAALHGLLVKIRDLGLPLLSVYRVESTDLDSENSPDNCK